MTPNPDVKDMSLFDVEYLRNGIRHSYNGILIGLTHALGVNAIYYEWNGKISTDMERRADCLQ